MLLLKSTILLSKSKIYRLYCLFRASEKFMKSYFLQNDNIIEKKLLAYIESQSFISKKLVNHQLKKIIKIYSLHFTHGDQKKALYALEKKELEMRRKDLIFISLFTGAISVTFVITLCILFIPGVTSPWEDWLEIFNNLYLFRFLLMIILTLVFTGIDVAILRNFKVNYLFIFELDPSYKITHIQFFRVSLFKVNKSL